MGREEDIAAFISALKQLQETPVDPEGFPTAGARIASAANPSLAFATRPEVDDMSLREGIPPTRFDWTINLGQILQATVLIVGLGGSIWHFSATQAENRRDIDNLVSRGLVYGPKVEALVKSQDVQDERIQNLNNSLTEIRRGNNDMAVIMGSIREDMATVKAKLSIERPR